jgi:hypothetical protein
MTSAAKKSTFFLALLNSSFVASQARRFEARADQLCVRDGGDKKE